MSPEHRTAAFSSPRASALTSTWIEAGQAHQLVDRPSRDLDVVTDSGGAATDVGPVAAAQMRGEGKSGSLFASLRGILFACP